MQASQPVYLTIDKETARKQILDRVDSIRTTQEGDRITVMSSTGFTLAHLSDYTRASGQQGTKLVYRTGPLVPFVLSPLVSKAHRIRSVVSRYER